MKTFNIILRKLLWMKLKFVKIGRVQKNKIGRFLKNEKEREKGTSHIDGGTYGRWYYANGLGCGEG